MITNLFTGLPFYVDDLGVRYRPGNLATLQACTDTQLGALAGNSIHTHVAAALTVWGLCSVVPRRACESLCMPLRDVPGGDVDDEDDLVSSWPPTGAVRGMGCGRALGG